MEQLSLRIFISLLFCFSCAGAASLDEAARELARRVSARIGRQGKIGAVASRAILGAPAGDRETADLVLRRELEGRVSQQPAADGDLRLTVSQIPGRGVLIAEIRRGEESAVFLEEYETSRRMARPAQQPASVQLDKRLLWEQDVPILDVAFTGARLLVLDAHGVSLASGGRLVERFVVPRNDVAPRDLRGRVVTQAGGTFRLWSSGVACRGTVEPEWRVDCSIPAGGIAAWPVAPGLEAELSSGTNHFERQGMQPFFSAAKWNGGPLVAAGVDGKTRFIETSGTRESEVNLGSDIAAIANPCEGGGGLLLSASENGARLAAFVYEGRRLRELPVSLETGGVLTALWAGEEESATLMARSSGGRYAAYRVAAVCGR